jgi:hypothetical protein
VISEETTTSFTSNVPEESNLLLEVLQADVAERIAMMNKYFLYMILFLLFS